ncbi:unnamed protein product, partial [marine sediment metagenome]
LVRIKRALPAASAMFIKVFSFSSIPSMQLDSRPAIDFSLTVCRGKCGKRFKYVPNTKMICPECNGNLTLWHLKIVGDEIEEISGFNSPEELVGVIYRYLYGKGTGYLLNILHQDVDFSKLNVRFLNMSTSSHKTGFVLTRLSSKALNRIMYSTFQLFPFKTRFKSHVSSVDKNIKRFNFQSIILKRLKVVNFTFCLFPKRLINYILNAFFFPMLRAIFINCSHCKFRWGDLASIFLASNMTHLDIIRIMQTNNIEHLHPNWVDV